MNPDARTAVLAHERGTITDPLTFPVEVRRRDDSRRWSRLRPGAGRRRRGLRGVKLVVSDAHEGIKAAVSKVLSASWQRCRVHFMRNVLAHAGKSGRRVVSAFIATAFAQETPEAASTQWRAVADQIRPKVPKLAAIHGRGRA